MLAPQNEGYLFVQVERTIEHARVRRADIIVATLSMLAFAIGRSLRAWRSREARRSAPSAAPSMQAGD